MLRRGIDPLVPQCFLRFATIALGELRPYEAPDVKGLNMMEADLIGIALHGAPAALDRAPSRITSGTGVTWARLRLVVLTRGVLSRQEPV